MQTTCKTNSKIDDIERIMYRFCNRYTIIAIEQLSIKFQSEKGQV